MRLSSAVIAVASLLLVPHSALAAKYPFEGIWDCKVANFTFTDSTYHNGSELMKFSTVKRNGKNFIITFPDGYRIALSNVEPQSMVWSSAESGDDFVCKRIK